MKNSVLKNKTKIQKIFFTILLAVVLIVITWIIYHVTKNRTKIDKNEEHYAVVCDDNDVYEFNKNIYSFDLSYENITKQTNEIESRSDFHKDPTCLYILTMNSTMLNNHSKANSYLVVLNKIDKDFSKVSEKFNQRKDINSLRSLVETRTMLNENKN